MQVFLDGLPPGKINELLVGQFLLPKIFGNPEIEGQLADETKFEARIAFVKGIRFDCPGTLQVHCYLEKFQLKTYGPYSDCEKWVFKLANLKLDCGDISTNYPAPLNAQPTNKSEGSHNAIRGYKDTANGMIPPKEGIDLESCPPLRLNSWQRNRITFKFADRNWNLDEDLFGQWPNRLDEIGQGPILSGTLSTAFNEGDTNEQVQWNATDITELLSFALARDVKWVSCGCIKKNGELFSLEHRYPVIFPFNHHWFPVVDNFEKGNLKKFLEKGQKELQSDRNWWLVTIGLLTQAKIAKYTEVKCSLLNMLLDRISTKVNAGFNQAEIDPRLEENLNKDFEDKLHQLLLGICSLWLPTRTKSICETIKKWNKEPSFSIKIQRTCEKLNIKNPFVKLLHVRHKLLHTGEFDSMLDNSEKSDYLCNLDALVSLFLIRIIGFDGYIYLQPYGDKNLLVDQVLKTTATQESNEAE